MPVPDADLVHSGTGERGPVFLPWESRDTVYPDVQHAIITDIQIANPDIIVRSTFEPATSTLSVSVHLADLPGGRAGKLLAHRVILTGSDFS